MLEPSDGAEAKEMIKYAFELSETLQKPVIFRTTTRINHSTMPVIFGDIIPPKTKGFFQKNPFEYVVVPAVARKLHVRLLESLTKAEEISETSLYNQETGSGEWGIICNGVSYGYAADARQELGLEDKIRMLRLGFSHPVPPLKHTLTAPKRTCQIARLCFIAHTNSKIQAKYFMKDISC